MPETPQSEAQHYLDSCTPLREALRIASGASLTAHALGQGEHNANFWFTHPESHDTLVLRMNYASQLGLQKQATYEFRALELLRECRRTPLPLFLDDTRAVVPRGVLVISHVEGAHLNFARQGDVREAARILADVHSARLPDQHHLIEPADPLQEQLSECERLFAAYCSSPQRDDSVVRRIEDFFEHTAQTLAEQSSEPGSRHILNTEAVPSHFLIPAKGGAGRMVDWEKPIAGEVAQDVAYFLAPTTTIWDTDFIFPVDERSRFVEAYWEAVGARFERGAFDARFDAYLKTNCLRGITWSCAAWAEYHNPTPPLRNEKTYRKLQVYLSDEFIDRLEREVFSL